MYIEFVPEIVYHSYKGDIADRLRRILNGKEIPDNANQGVNIMIIKRYTAALIAAAMMCGALASCSSKSSKSDNSSSPAAASDSADTTSAKDAEPTIPPDIEVEDQIAAESGDAFLAINEAQGWCQYFGTTDDPKHTMLTYNAGVVKIEGNGKYKVSVTADTVGFRLDTASDPNDDSVVPSGLMFSAVKIKDGNTLFPDAVMTIDSIKVDGKELKLTAKNYTSSDDGKELRSNIFNEWVKELPDDARSVEGALKPDGKLSDKAKAYSPMIVDKNDFEKWKTVEVEFTVSGIKK